MNRISKLLEEDKLSDEKLLLDLKQQLKDHRVAMAQIDPNKEELIRHEFEEQTKLKEKIKEVEKRLGKKSIY